SQAATVTGTSAAASLRWSRRRPYRTAAIAAASGTSSAASHGHGGGPIAYHSHPARRARRPSTSSGIDHCATRRGVALPSDTDGRGRKRLSCQAYVCPDETRRQAGPDADFTASELPTTPVDQAVGEAALAATPSAEKRRNGSPSRPRTITSW